MIAVAVQKSHGSGAANGQGNGNANGNTSANANSSANTNSSNNGNGSANGHSAHAATASNVAADTAPHLTPSVAVGGGNENAANGHASGPTFKTHADGPPQPGPLVSSSGEGASPPPGHGPGAAPRKH